MIPITTENANLVRELLVGELLNPAVVAAFDSGDEWFLQVRPFYRTGWIIYDVLAADDIEQLGMRRAWYHDHGHVSFGAQPQSALTEVVIDPAHLHLAAE